MKKKFASVFGVLIIAAALLLTPTAPLITTGVRALATADETVAYTPPTQDVRAFDHETTTYDLNDWQKSTNDNLIATKVSHDNNYHENTTYQDITLSGDQIGSRQPFMLLAKNTRSNGSLSLSEITLAANSYYTVAVDYCIMGNDADQSFFYLGDTYLPLQRQNNWRTAMFLVQTDRLTATTLPVRLFLGSPTQDVYGAAYYDNFTVTALTVTDFNNKKAHLDKIDQMFWDFTNNTDVKEEQVVDNTAFSIADGSQANVILRNNLNNEDVAKTLNYFDDERNYFHSQSGKGNVMLMAAQGNNASLTLADYTFKPLSHQVYMFQFYSIMPADMEQFYFCIGDTYQKITAVDYPTHNGWQLNTIFYVAGHDATQEFTLSFALGAADESAVTGWVALDDLRIYRVSDDYATANTDALGAQAFNDANSDEDWVIANGSFELGTATRVPGDKTYPYPLKADSWTTEGSDNGIVNTNDWKFSALTTPGAISERYDVNNNIYMLRNTSATENKVTSPAITTTAGATTYVSFDAHTTDAAPLYVSFQTTEGVELNRFTIKDNAWQHYELAITEHASAVTRSYQLVFTIKNVGAAYLDNFRSESTPYLFADANTTTVQTIDLTSPVNVAGLWQTTDSTLAEKLATSVDRNGITLRNEDQATIVVQYGLDYTLTADEYYRVSVTARGEKAFVELNGFDGYFTVTTDANDADALTTYNFYCQPTDTTTLNFLVTLGSKEANTYYDGNIYLTNLTVTNITEADYNLATKNLGDHDKVVKVSEANDDEPTTDDESDPNNFFGENWWYLIPTLITAVAILIAVASFLWRRLKFDKHVTAKNTTYARDMQLKNTQKKIVAQKSAKVDNIKDETPHSN